jgi:threonyl-tRNA synthetase
MKYPSGTLVAVISSQHDSNSYADEVAEALRMVGVASLADKDNVDLTHKLASVTAAKLPHVLVVGPLEQSDRSVIVWSLLPNEENNRMPLDQFIGEVTTR